VKKVKAIVLRTAGTNCDQETVFALQYVGAQVENLHINRLLKKERPLADYQILVIPGGFTYGDDVSAGKLLANELKFKLHMELREFIQEGKLVIGICNGFQVLVKAGFLPGNKKVGNATLTYNDSGKFEDRWVYLKIEKGNRCVFTQGMHGLLLYLPVAHAEGKFVPENNRVMERLQNEGQIVLRYVDPEGNLNFYPWNPNGSVGNIAGICDSTGRIFGIMPHPERHIHPTAHPHWMRIGLKKEGEGVAFFKNAVDYALKL